MGGRKWKALKHKTMKHLLGLLFITLLAFSCTYIKTDDVNCETVVKSERVTKLVTRLFYIMGNGTQRNGNNRTVFQG